MKKQALIIGGLSAIGLTAIYLTFIHKFKDGLTGWKKLTAKKPDADKKEGEDKKDADTYSDTKTKPDPKGFVSLKTGDRNDFVKTMQTALREQFNEFAIVSDGIWGPKTGAALNRAGYKSPINFADYMGVLGGTKK